jgi:hypothetical protein
MLSVRRKLSGRTLNTILASAAKARTASINPPSASPNMFNKIVCAGGDEGKLFSAETLCKIAFSVEIEGSDISHIGRPMSEHLALMCREIALSLPLYLNE